MKQVEINGLLWDTENLEIKGERYFTWVQALEIAEKLGKRLPTKIEFMRLIDGGYVWKNDNKGIVLNNGNLDIPAYGYKSDDWSMPYGIRSIATLWTSTLDNECDAYYFRGNVNRIYLGTYNNRRLLPIRCVQDIKGDNNVANNF